jgi:hypothetical protein
MVKVELAQGGVPDVFVETPSLCSLSGGRKLPHVYSEAPVELCLYLPTTHEWKPHDRLDLTVVPWAYLWLHYFEDWLTTGEWRGGGRHPQRTTSGGTRARRSNA